MVTFDERPFLKTTKLAQGFDLVRAKLVSPVARALGGGGGRQEMKLQLRTKANALERVFF